MSATRCTVELRNSHGVPVLRDRLLCDEVTDARHPRAGWWCLVWSHWYRATPIDGEPGVFYVFLLAHEVDTVRRDGGVK